MSVKRPSYATSTTDFTEFQPNFPKAPSMPRGSRIKEMKENRPENQLLPPMMPQAPPPQQFSLLPQVFQMDQDFLPQEVLFLLSQEDNHIRRFRERVDRDKTKLQRDIKLVKAEIVNMLDDLAMQMGNFIEDHFKRYTNVYSLFKEEIIQFKNQKLEAPLNLVPPPPQLPTDECSNSNLIQELEEMRYRNYVGKVNAYIGELARVRLESIQTVSRDLLQLTSHDGFIYNSEATNRQLNAIKSDVEAFLIQKFGNMMDYILPLDFLHGKKQPHSDQKKSRLSGSDAKTYGAENIKGYSMSNNSMQDFRLPPTQYDIPRAQPMMQNDPINVQQYGQSNFQPAPKPSFSSPIDMFSQSNFSNLAQKSTLVNTHLLQGRINLDIEQLQSVNTPHNALTLCFTHIRENVIATGSKDAVIKIWDTGAANSSMSLLATLKGHKGGICTLATISCNQIPYYLASGSDHGDNSIKIWSVQNFKEYRSLNKHTAAVVALLSLDDGQTVVSGSYDKSIQIWNVDQEQPVQTLMKHTNAVTCLALGKGRFVSGGLDQLINLFRINYTGQGQFHSAELERQIVSPTLICALNMVQVSEKPRILCGGKDGRVRDYDASTGTCVQTIIVGSKPIVEMLVVQENSQAFSLLTMSNKERNLVYTSNGQNRVLETNDSIQIEFGCGVYPKMELVDRGGQIQLLVINQAEDNQYITKYKL